jgi:hypothetical protein
MLRITENPSSGRLVQCLIKNYKNDYIVSVDMHQLGVMAAYSDPLCVRVQFTVYEGTDLRVRICCHNTDLVHLNGHDTIIIVIFSQTLYKAP